MRIWATLAAVGALSLAGCSDKAQVNYRITVEVDDNGVTHSGTGVWSVSMQGGGFPDKFTSKFSGEAIPVDLGSKGTLFVLIVGRGVDQRPTSTELGIWGRHLFGDVARQLRGEPQKHLSPLDETREFASMTGKSATIDCVKPPTKYTPCPFMVRFRDVRDPQTAEGVDPTNLTSTFGQGVQLKPIKVVITNGAVTTGIDKRFIWWNEYIEKHFDGTSTSYQDLKTSDLKAVLSSGYFSTEILR